jgi:2-(1,2-epoxy-1,2-dihydrophenyl)acetyl-CoA isomerase
VPLSVNVGDDHVAVVEFDNPPHNHFDPGLLAAIADAYEECDTDARVRAIVLCSTGKHFCAGADFGGDEGFAVQSFYDAAYRMFKAQTPVVAAVQGAAVGGGLGLAMSADFRIATPATRFQANFVRLGLHHGFGLTVSLPRVVGEQTAAELLLTGAAVKGEEALSIGLCDGLASTEPADDLRTKARDFAAEIAAGAPLAVRSIRATMRGDLAERIREATAREAEEQARLFATEDFKEGVAATAERRPPNFTGS